MTIPHAKIIVNPQAGRGATRHKWAQISDLLKHIHLSFDYEFTTCQGHAAEIAEKSVSKGYEYLVAVGGDGTVHEVVNGILRAKVSRNVLLGMVGTGTGSDLARSLGISRDTITACAGLTATHKIRIDAGMVEYHKNGKKVQRYYINGAGIGFDASVVRNVESIPKYFGGTIPYLTGVLRTLITYRNKRISLTIGNNRESLRVLSVIAANGRYLGGGMQVTPLAKVDDSLLDILIVGDITKWDLLKTFPRVYKGTHLTHPLVRLEKAREIRIESEDRFLVHADGELLGEGPASFKIIPSALDVVV